MKGTRPAIDPSLTEEFWLDLTGESQPTQRDQFLWLSIHLVRELGLAQFTITQVARQLGYSVAMVNHHFGSRDGLIAEGAETVHLQYSSRLIDAAENAGDNPRARLEAYVDARIALGREQGGWAQVLNFPFHSFESPQIAMARVGSGFNDSFNRNLRYMTQLIVDYRNGKVSHSTIEGDGFPQNVLASDPTALLHAINIGTATAGTVMWMTGRIDTGTHGTAINDLTNTMAKKQVQLLIDSIPTI